jgi:CofH/MqnC C-terminal region
VTFDRLLERVSAGEALGADELTELAAAHDILSLGILGDATRRRLHGTQTTYVRVARCAHDRSFVDAVPAAAGEIRITGAPDTLTEAVAVTEAARTVAGSRTVSGFSWADVERLAANVGTTSFHVLAPLRASGLDALADLPLDTVADIDAAVDELSRAGFQQLRLTVEKAPAIERTPLLLQASALQRRHRSIHTINPLPTVVSPLQPTTGYDDVKAVAIARLAAPNIASVQVDWLRYGPKLAQVALTFGADDVDGVTASDDAPDGRRRAPLEEVRRGIEAAGFSPVERDGRFQVIS